MLDHGSYLRNCFINKNIISEYMFSQGPITCNGLLHKQKLVLLIFVCLFGFFVLMQVGCSYGGWRNIKD